MTDTTGIFDTWAQLGKKGHSFYKWIVALKEGTKIDKSRVMEGSVVEGFKDGQMTAFGLFKAQFAPESSVIAYELWKCLSEDAKRAYAYVGRMYLEKKVVDQETGEVTVIKLTPYNLFKQIMMADMVPLGWPCQALPARDLAHETRHDGGAAPVASTEK